MTAAPPVPLSVDIVNRQRRHRVDRARLEAACRSAHHAGGGRQGGIALLLSGDRRIRELNRSFRGQDRATDVLSFPDGESSPEGRHLGDIAISVETARRNAEHAGGTLDEELDRLVVHGVLHLLGFDHEVDGGEMMALQARILRRLPRQRP